MTFKKIVGRCWILLLFCSLPSMAQMTPAQELSGYLFSGNLAKIQEILNRNPSLMNSMDGKSPLAPIHMLMSIPPNPKVLETVFRYSFDLNQSVDGQTPLGAAVVAGNVMGIQRILAAGAKPTALGPDGGNCLHMALGRAMFNKVGTLEMVNALLAGGVDPNQRNKAGRPLLMVAVGLASTDDALAASIVSALIGAGGEPDPDVAIQGKKVPLSKMLSQTPPKTAAALRSRR